MDYFDILLAKKLNGGGGGDITIEDLYVNANGEYTAPSGKAYGKITANVPAPSNAIYKQTLSNLPSPIATFTGADAPLDSLKASIVGVQDLHGYDKPWPAGGGKNKFGGAVTTSNMTFLDGNATNTATDTRTVFNARVVLYKNGSVVVSKDAGEISSAGAYNISFLAAYDFDEVELKHNGAQRDLSVKAPIIANSVVSISFHVDGYNPSIVGGLKIQNIQAELSSTPTAYTPYSNICPISGWSSCDVTDNGNTYTIPFKDSSDNPITVYGGGIDVTGGKLTVTHANIASYNGETINEPWISSEDIYTQGATPTTGAQVVYPLTTPLIYDVDPIALRSNGITNISVDCGEVMELKYYSDTP